MAGTADHLQMAWFQRQNAFGAERDMDSACSVRADNGHDLARDLSVGLPELGMPPV